MFTKCVFFSFYLPSKVSIGNSWVEKSKPYIYDYVDVTALYKYTLHKTNSCYLLAYCNVFCTDNQIHRFLIVVFNSIIFKKIGGEKTKVKIEAKQNKTIARKRQNITLRLRKYNKKQKQKQNKTEQNKNNNNNNNKTKPPVK